MTGVVDDLIQLQSQLASDRSYWEDVWRDCVNLAMPYASYRYDFSGSTVKSSMTGLANGPDAARRSKELYDGEAVWASERLAGGMESAVSPFHFFKTGDADDLARQLVAQWGALQPGPDMATEAKALEMRRKRELDSARAFLAIAADMCARLRQAA